MPNKLLSARKKARPSNAVASSSRSHRAAKSELPPYEPLSAPLNDAARRRLQELANMRTTKNLEVGMTKSATFLQLSIGAINDRACERRREADLLAQRRKRKEREEGTAIEKSANETRAAEIADQFAADALSHTQQIEAAMRRLIDLRATLEDESAVFAKVQEETARQRPQAQPHQRPEKRKRPRREAGDRDGGSSDSGGGDEEMDEDESEAKPEPQEPLIPLSQLLKAARKEKRDEYSQMTMHERYGLNNDYIQLKKTWHDANHPNDEVALPSASRWFDRHGEPVMGVGANGQESGDDEDDELVVAREHLSYRCPLSLQPMKEPYSNRQCKHTFEKANIVDYIRRHNGVARCPQAGCDKDLRPADFYLDQIMLRKIKRAEQAAREDLGDSDAELDGQMEEEEQQQQVAEERAAKEEEEEPEPEPEEPVRQVKKERTRRSRVLEADDD